MDIISYNKSKKALQKADNVQEQLDQIVVEGDSSVEAAQARVSSQGTTYPTLKARLDAEQQETTVQLAETNIQKADRTELQQVSLSYKESYATLAALELAYPTGNVYNHAVLSDGFIYTWNGSVWVSTQIQANGTGIANGTVTPEKLSFKVLTGVQSKNLFNKATASLNKNINTTNGSLTDLAGFFVSDFIDVESSQSYIPSGRAGQNIVFVLFNAGGGVEGSFTNPVSFETTANTKRLRFRSAMSVIDAIQLEKGTVATSYEAFKVFVDDATIRDNSLDASKLKAGIPASKLSDYEIGKNKIDTTGMTAGFALNTSNGTLFANASYSTTAHRPMKPNTQYTLKFARAIGFFDANGTFISGRTSSDPATFTSPSNVATFRTNLLSSDVGTQQLEEGTVSTPFERYGYVLKDLLIDTSKINFPSKKRTRIYTFKDAWVAWENNQKFPVAFLGDSQTDGNATTGFTGHYNADMAAGGYGKADYHAPNAYSKVLQDLIRKETGSTVARIYNAGYSGTTMQWAKTMLDELFGYAYSDVKMVGLVHGTNDRTAYLNTAAFESGFRNDLEIAINHLYAKGIQPFLVTGQALADAGRNSEYVANGTQLIRTSEVANSIGNRVKKELAEKYDLEIIDMNTFGEFFMNYSKEMLTSIIADKLHFGNVGHKAEGGFLFKHFCPRVMDVYGNEILTFTSQKIKSKAPADLYTYLSSPEDGFKIKANFTKADSLDLMIQDFWFFNNNKGLVAVKSFVTATGATYVKLNDQVINLTDLTQTLSSTLDVGLHHVEAWTGLSDKVDFKGFKVEVV